MKILITGASGMLGTAVREVFSNHELLTPTSKELDVRDIGSVAQYIKTKPDLILHLAAVTDHLKSELEWENTYLTNHTGTQNIISLSLTLDIPIVYIASCTEYDGSKEAHTEEDILSPCNHYSVSKAYGEWSIRANPKNWIIRSGWLFGGGPGIDKKFLNAIVYKLIKSGVKEFPSIVDSVGQPTYTYDLARTIKNMIEGNAPYGTYNVAGLGVASRFDMATLFVSCLGADVKVIPVTAEEYHKKYPEKVKYHKRAVMDLSKIQASGFSAMRPWEVTLKEYAEEFK